MGLEAATYINQLNAANPVGATDPKAQGDDHLRLIKSTLQASFPNITGAMVRTHTELNAVGSSGITGFAIAANKIKGSGAAAAGAATTALRSDVQMLLDLADTYAWTGSHSFGGAGGFYAIKIVGTAPAFQYNDTGASLNNKKTTFEARGSATRWSFIDDAEAFGPHDIIAATRNQTTVLTVSFGNSADNPIFTFLGTGATNIANPHFNAQVNFESTSGGFMEIVNRTAGAQGLKIYHGAAGSAPLTIIDAAGRLQLVDGTAALPFVAPASDPNSGMFSVGPDQLGWSVGGTRATYLANVAGVIQLLSNDGSVGAPFYSFNSDSDCGDWRIGADNIGRSVGGVLVMDWLGIASGGARVKDPGGTMQPVGYRNIPISGTTTTLAIGDVGKCIPISANINIPASVFAAGDAVNIINDTAGALSLTISAGTLRLAGTTSTGTRTLAARAQVSVYFRTGGATPEVYASGAGVS